MSRPDPRGRIESEPGPAADQIPPSVTGAAGEPMRDAPSRQRAEPDGVLPLYTPARAAELLAVRESWLRRRAGHRAVPCTFLGKHLRFSHADLIAIAAGGAQPPRRAHHTPTGPRARPTEPRRNRPRPSRPAQAPRSRTARTGSAERSR